MSDELTRQLESDLANPIAAEIPPEELAKIKDRYAAWQASGDTTLFDCEELMALQECLLYGADGYYGSLDFAQCVSAFDAFLDENGFAWKPCIGIVGYPLAPLVGPRRRRDAARATSTSSTSRSPSTAIGGNHAEHAR